MQHPDVSDKLRAVIAELDQVRRSLMADEPRRKIFMQTVKAKSEAEALLSDIQDDLAFRSAAE